MHKNCDGSRTGLQTVGKDQTADEEDTPAKRAYLAISRTAGGRAEHSSSWASLHLKHVLTTSQCNSMRTQLQPLLSGAIKSMSLIGWAMRLQRFPLFMQLVEHGEGRHKDTRLYRLINLI